MKRRRSSRCAAHARALDVIARAHQVATIDAMVRACIIHPDAAAWLRDDRAGRIGTITIDGWYVWLALAPGTSVMPAPTDMRPEVLAACARALCLDAIAPADLYARVRGAIAMTCVPGGGA